MRPLAAALLGEPSDDLGRAAVAERDHEVGPAVVGDASRAVAAEDVRAGDALRRLGLVLEERLADGIDRLARALEKR